MNTPDAGDSDRATIAKTSAELLAAVNASDVDRCSAVWAANGVLMPPHHPAVRGHRAIAEYFRNLFSQSRFRFAFTSSHIQFAGDAAFEHVTYTATVWSGGSAQPLEEVGKGLHVYRREPNGAWRLTYDIWNSDQPVGS
jgi:ketosteroid isomerase-like protein